MVISWGINSPTVITGTSIANLKISGGVLTINSGQSLTVTELSTLETSLILGSGHLATAQLYLNTGCCISGVSLDANTVIVVSQVLTVGTVSQVEGGIIRVLGDIHSADPDLGGSTIFQLSGTGDQTLSGSGRLNNLDVRKPSGNVLLPANLNIAGGWLTGDSSRFVNTGGMPIFGIGYISYTGSIDDAAFNSGCCTYGIGLGADLTINHSLTISDIYGVEGYTINIAGDLHSTDADLGGSTIFRLNGTGDQTVSGTGRINNLDVRKPSGNVLLPANFAIAGGWLTGDSSRFVNNGGKLIFGGGYISYTGSIDDAAFNSGCCVYGVGLGADLTINHSLTISDVYGVEGYTINIAGDLRSDDADLGGSTIFRLNGTGDQTVSGSGRLNNLDVRKPSGNVLLPANFAIAGGWLTGDSSRFVNTGGKLIFGGGYISYTGSIDDAAFNSGCCVYGVGLGADLTINHSLTISDVYGVEGYTINIAGNLRSDDADLGGSTIFRLNGTGDQTVSGTGRINNLDVRKPSGNVLLPANLNIAGGWLTGDSSRFVNTGGKLIFGGGYISYTGSIDDAAFNSGCCVYGVGLGADLTINHSLTISDVYGVEGYTVNIAGNLRSDDADLGGSTIFRLNGSSDQTLSGTGRINNLEVAKSSGRVLFSGNRSFVSVLISSGLFEPNGFAVTAPVTINGGRLGGQGVIIGNVIANSGGAINAGTALGDTGQLGIQGDLVLNSGSFFRADINGDIPASQYDQVIVTGTVTIDSAIITGTTGASPNTSIAILLNDSSDDIGGARFSNAPNTGNTVTLGSETYQLAYNGGTGNDLTLALPPPTGLQVSSSSPTQVGAPTFFTATLATGSHISYTWDFGDGSPSQLQQSTLISYTYGAIDHYLVTVMASNAQGFITTTVPVTITPSGQVVEAITPGVAESLVYNSPDGAKVTVGVPTGAITQSLYLVYNTVITPTQPPPSLTFGRRAFRLEAWLGDQLLPGLTFAPPLTLTLDYLPSDVNGVDEQRLAIYYFDTTSNQWRDDGVTIVSRDPINHRIVVGLSHLTEFALFQPKLPPLVMNDSDLALVDTPLQVAAPGVLANDSDPEGGALHAQLVVPPIHGVVSLATTGGFVYTPTLGFTGMDSFEYAADNGFFTTTGTVTIYVFQPGAAAGPIVLPAAGWNLFGYPLASSRPVTDVLASLSGVYTTVFGYDVNTPSDPWLMYDPGIPAPFDTIVNRLKTFDYGRGYWINLRQPATITLASALVTGMSSGNNKATLTPQPPATFYGEVIANGAFVPRAGLRVEAELAGVLCGQSKTQALANGQVIYAIHVFAAGDGAQQGCGRPGQTVTLHVDGRILTTVAWSNEQTQRLQTTQPADSTNGISLYLPLIAKR